MSQIVVFDSNRSGLVADVTSVLEEADVNIESINAFSLKGYGLIYLEVNNHDKALFSLKESGCSAVTDAVKLLILKDQPGSLAKVSSRFKEANISLDSIRILKRLQESDHVLVGVKFGTGAGSAEHLLDDVLVESRLSW